MEGGPSNTLSKFYHGKERNWVAMDVGTLVTNEERMFECIHVKILVSFMLI
jgi:hypothetical protein